MSKKELSKEEIEDIKYVSKNILKGLKIPKKFKKQVEVLLDKENEGPKYI